MILILGTEQVESEQNPNRIHTFLFAQEPDWTDPAIQNGIISSSTFFLQLYTIVRLCRNQVPKM